MKRSLLIVAIALLTVAFVSCQKDGVYKPKQKISKIYNELIRTTVSEVNGVSTTVNDTVKPYVTEEWNWGKKTLESIVYKDMDGRNDGTCFFTYDDKNRITEMKEGETKVEYSYSDDKKLQITKLYSEGELILAMEIAYEDKLPHIITSTSYDDDALIKNLLLQEELSRHSFLTQLKTRYSRRPFIQPFTLQLLIGMAKIFRRL